jgi:hypothetical protein
MITDASSGDRYIWPYQWDDEVKTSLESGQAGQIRADRDWPGGADALQKELVGINRETARNFHFRRRF